MPLRDIPVTILGGLEYKDKGIKMYYAKKSIMYNSPSFKVDIFCSSSVAEKKSYIFRKLLLQLMQLS